MQVTDEMRAAIDGLKAAMGAFHASAQGMGFESSFANLSGRAPEHDSFALFDADNSAYEVDGDALKLVERGLA